MPRSTQFRIAKTPLALACAAAFLSGPAAAQEESFALEEVLVTASKRTESLQDVGMSITALGSDDLQRMGAVELLDFAVRIPNLAMAYESDGRFDSSSPSIRGVFGKDTTGFYIDDTPVNASMLPRVSDVERVEVLRGPQGSLYGARSMGGTIRMITKQPDLSEAGGQISANVSTVEDGDENYSVDGSYNIPIVEDVFALRVSGYYGQNSGIYDRVYQESWVRASDGAVIPNSAPAFDENENVDDESYWGGQVVANWQITDNLRFVPKVIMQQVEADGLPFADRDPEETTEVRFFDTEEDGTDEWYIASGTFFWDIDAGQFTSTTSYYDRETDEREEEASFLHNLFNTVIEIPVDPLESPLSTVEKYESVTHETRFTSSFDGPFQFTAGIFYSDGEFDHEYPRALQPGLGAEVDRVLEAPPGTGDEIFGLRGDDLIFVTTTLTETDEIAVFGELTWEFNEWLSITGGGRWYESEVTAVNQADGFANSGTSSYDDEQKEDGFNPKVLVEVVVNDDINVYASGAKGFRIGGINGNLPSGLCGPELETLGINPQESVTYDSDELWSYEVGFKSSFNNNRVVLNGAAYFIDWTDVQQLNRLACGFQFTANAGEAESKGFEIELNAAITQGLTASLGVGYTDAEITDSGGTPGISDGDSIQGVPDWTVNGSVEYIFPFTGDWDGMLRADGNYYGDSFSSNNESSGENQRLREAWSAVNLRAGMLSERYEITLYVDNATDERANLADSRSIAAETPGRQRLVTNRPRTIGLEARLRF
ncbi:MAG: TonB-dependent receptor [Halioglobus sp.]